MFYYIDDSDGSLWAYDLEKDARPGLRGPLTPEELYAIQHPPLTPEQILANNINQQTNLAYAATNSMLPHFLLAINLGDGTDEETVKAKTWQSYYRDLKAVNLTSENPGWPIVPQD